MHFNQFGKSLFKCALLGIFVVGCDQMRAKVWVEQIDELAIQTDGVNKIAITTHNGPIEVTGDSERSDMHVVVTRKGGGRNKESARAALDALEIVSDLAEDGTHNLGYRWNVSKQFDWKARVSFKVSMPPHLMTQAKTHNGTVKVTNVDGDCDLVTHNGAITAVDVRSACNIETYNGPIKIDSPEATVNAVTHNGAIAARWGIRPSGNAQRWNCVGCAVGKHAQRQYRFSQWGNQRQSTRKRQCEVFV